MKAKHSIIPILEHYGLTVYDGGDKWQKCKCPFHDDRHASAAVNTELNTFKCFACMMGGDVYKIIMQKEGKSFSEALTFAEGMAGDGDQSLSKEYSSRRRVPSNTRSNIAGRKYTPPRGRRGTANRA